MKTRSTVLVSDVKNMITKLASSFCPSKETDRQWARQEANKSETSMDVADLSMTEI
jgi:hypothetical protein